MQKRRLEWADDRRDEAFVAAYRLAAPLLYTMDTTHPIRAGNAVTGPRTSKR